MSFRTLLERLMPRHNSNRSRRAALRPGGCRLVFEPLEDRLTPAAVLSIWDAATLEGNTGAQNAAVTVTLSEPHSNAVSVIFRTADGTATAGSDYNAVSGTLNFAKNVMSKTILVPIRGDRVLEPDEYFFVRLDSAKAGAKIANGQAIVTIMDDEPRISIYDVSQLEGNSGTTPFNFTVSLSAPYDMPVTVNFATADGSATDGIDYTGASGTLIITPGNTSATVPVQVNGNQLAGPNKSFLVNVTTPNTYAEISRGTAVGTIIDDEPRISIGDAYNYGESTFTFTVYLSAAHEGTVTVDFATQDGTAFDGVDYVGISGTLTFDPTEMSKTITIEVLDATSMPDKYFYIHLSNASSNALIANEWATGYWYYDYGYYDYGYYDYGYGYGSYDYYYW
jgi:Calx-beta domain